MKLRDTSCLLFNTRTAAVIVLLGALGFSPVALSNCSWNPVSEVAFTQSELQFTGLARWLRKTLWVDERRYPPGTLLALSTVSLSPAMCTGLSDLRSKYVDFVYVPPPSAVRAENGYLIPATARGVALKLEFPEARGSHRHGLLLSTSSIPVTPGGVLLAAGMPWLNMRVAVVKTASFEPLAPNGQSHLVWPGGLGWIRFYDQDQPDICSVRDIAIAMGPLAVEVTGLPGTAVGAYCRVGPNPARGGVRSGNVLRPGSVIALPAVRRSDFTGPGPLEQGSQEVPLFFSCIARAASEVKVSFDATYPFNGGLDGVGMPAPESDIGVQIVLAGQPVQLGINSQRLGWNFIPSTGYPLEVQGRSVQGRFCVAGCGAQTSQTSSAWVEGDGGIGHNEGMEAPITFKYFQTGRQRPLPNAFSVPFTVTLDWQ
jgi:hypothetical protein